MRLNCPICGDSRSTLIDQRPVVPVLMHNTFPSAEAARACQTGQLSMRRCEACGFVWNAAFEPDKIVYEPGYDNAQGYSPHFQRHLDERVDAILAEYPAGKPLNIIEVGAGQGDFLKRMANRGGCRIGRAIGFDPAWNGADSECIPTDSGCDIRMYRRIFDGTAAALAAEIDVDLVVSRHVIEHVSEPLAFLKSIRAGIIKRPATKLFLETPDIDWILRQGAFEDFFYEHCSIFNPASMATGLRLAGFGNRVVSTVFGGQYLWAIAQFAADGIDQPLREGASLEPTPDFSTGALERDWQARIRTWHQDGGRIAIWGAGAKGMTFARIVDPTVNTIAAIIDVNPGKQDRFIGVTGHRIIGPEALGAVAPTHIIVMNPNYAAEIREMLAASTIHASLLTLHEDFS